MRASRQNIESASRRDGYRDPSKEKLIVSLKILVVDDEPAIVEYFTALLTQAGFQVLPVCDPFEAIEKTAEFAFDAVLVGYVMPGMLGTDAAVRIKSFSPDTKVIIAIEEVPTEEKSRLAGSGYTFDFLPMPFERQELLEKLRR
jgi:CheY-like chemotaxis protein